MSDRAATILLPTFNHGPTVRYAIESALAQTVTDFELIVIGDGAPPISRQIVAEYAARDSRIRYLDLPKDPSRGETHRHVALQAARGRIVAYLGDDDLWLPHHLATLIDLLADADLANTLPVRVQPEGDRLMLGPAGYVDLRHPLYRGLFAQPTSGFSTNPTWIGHTLDFYRRLPYGWRRTPPGLPSDGYMYVQMLAVPGIRVASRPAATGLNFHNPHRRHWSAERRAAELAIWWGRLSDPVAWIPWQRRLAEIEAWAVRRARLLAPLWVTWHLVHNTPLARPAERLTMAICNRPIP